jgi:hypothetical protein
LCVCGIPGAVRASEPAPPVALSATDVAADGFTANWRAVPGADGYRLDVWRFDGVPPTTAREGFDGYPETVPEGWAITNNVKDAVYATAANSGLAIPAVKLSDTNHAVTTPAYPAAVTNVAFWFKGFSVGASTLCMDASNATGWVTLDAFGIPTSGTATQFLLAAGNDYRRFKLTFNKVGGGVGIDDVSASYGDGAKVFVLSNAVVGDVTSHAVDGLAPGLYFYAVRASDGEEVSADSNVIEVDTEAPHLPPRIAPVPAQTARVGETLTFALAVTATDGDPVTETNATASAGVAGPWALSGGVFTYTPAAEDLGERSFTFAARDKDGWSDEVTVAVRVRPARTAAVLMAEATGAYAQDFDALAQSGQENVWDNAAEPLPAWYAYANAAEATVYRTGTGSATAGGIYSFGAAGGADRALGSLASGGNTLRYGAAFTNGTGQAVTNLSVRFRAAQWRVGANAATNALVFEYCVTNRALPLHQGVWRRVNALCFDSPLVTNATQDAGAATASSELSAVVTRPVPAGEVILLRWSDPDDAGNDHAFGIDDLEVDWAAGAMPEAIHVSRTGAAEDFDEMGEDADGWLPWLWRIETRDDAPRASGAYAAASERVSRTGGVSAPGSYRFTSGGVRDQAVGALPGASQAKSVSVSAKFRNGAGTSVRSWNVRFAVEKYRNGLAGCAVRLLCSTDGTVWAEAGEPVAFPADADTSGFPVAASPGATVAAERAVAFDAPVAPGGVFYLAWQISVAEGDAVADAQALAVDDVRIEPVLARANLFMLK